MKKELLIIGLLILSFFKGFSQSNVAKNVWLDIVELEQGILQRHIVNDLPGSIIMLIPKTDGKSYNVKILGNKVLVNNSKLPEIKQEPTLLVSDLLKKDIAVNLSYLSFISAGMANSDEVNFSITETSHTSIVDGEINWKKFDERVAKIKKDNPKLPANTVFAVLKVASVIAIEHQVFKSVTKATKIEGFGFAGDAKFLSQSTQKKIDFKVGVALAFSESSIVDILNFNNKLMETYDKSKITKNGNKGLNFTPENNLLYENFLNENLKTLIEPKLSEIEINSIE
ncbi:hypothetical protein GJU43_22550 [Flavobacterium sp. LC2016-23]|uniref:hypothetical protein n=1 Tax=Flavobacterium sp. LC2016-23 TaxID=2666330 RepID=UPI0012AF30C0|nr:hypothetical protein [Flavobacterium sp. LC2016-23]MRX42065.1 hypothetical protein [Flavobacterium sp. LC2016-23]